MPQIFYYILAFIPLFVLIKEIKSRSGDISEALEQVKGNECNIEWKSIGELEKQHQKIIVKQLLVKKKPLALLLIGLCVCLISIILWLMFGNVENSEDKTLGMAFAVAFLIVLFPFTVITIIKCIRILSRKIEFQEGVIEKVVERQKESQGVFVGNSYYRRKASAQVVVNKLICNFLIYPNKFNPMAFQGDNENDWIIGQPAIVIKPKGSTTSIAPNVILVSTLSEKTNTEC